MRDWKSWALSLFVAISGTFGMWAWSSTVQRVEKLEDGAITRAERIVRTEQESIYVKESMIRIEKKIDDLIDKIDRQKGS